MIAAFTNKQLGQLAVSRIRKDYREKLKKDNS